ncbi:type II toxin-antitoxin system RelE/ParE family toxin [Marinicella gelatinilytica]|uniref:type II toxin-antitoxin system RelE/ParE family toxin n=1 Tax=Marinicella gelatinilytica TaxID=2996017 RepID=UPI002260BFAF|nr:type II toxin-antitoxin system RelE/ParE family toxin [Marinicella gelatinilytica]MCX7545115.1 type II toxin-antitoxin system RelE/ParE family toxin [Marinicella gelatinilytica]
MTIKLRPKAYDDLTRIYQYSLKEFGQAKAIQYLSSIDEAFQKINRDTGIGTDYSHISPELFGLPGCITHHIFKQANHNLIVIRVLHQAMDFTRHL